MKKCPAVLEEAEREAQRIARINGVQSRAKM